MRILIADDELVSRNKMLTILRSYGRCDTAANGGTALELVCEAEEPYDLLFLDIEMPVMNGMSVLHKIRNMENKRDVPAEKRIKIIMTTAHADKDTIVQCLREGCNDYILKPVNKETLEKKIARFL